MSDCLYARYNDGDCGMNCDGINHHYDRLENAEREKLWRELFGLFNQLVNSKTESLWDSEFIKKIQELRRQLGLRENEK